MTTSAVYDLIPNEDGGQNTRYPLGNKPAAELAPPIPTFLDTSGETLTSVALSWGQLGDGHTKFVIQRWRLNTDTAWTLITEPGKDTRSYTDSANLEQGQHVGYRIASSDGVNQSDWAPEAWTYVLRESTGTTDLTKIRWSADWSDAPDGVPANKDSFYGMYNIYNGVVSSEKLFNGRKTIKEVCDWGPDQFWGTGFGKYVGAPKGEQNAEMWFRVWVYHDPGFSWTTETKLRKTLRMGEELPDTSVYAGGYADLYTVWPDYFRGSEPGGINYIRESVNDGPEGGWWPLDPTAASQQQTGVWECLEFYVKSNSNAGQGAIKYWKNGVLIGEVPNCRTRLHAESGLVKCLFINNWNAGLDKVCTYWWSAPAIAVRNSTRDDVPFMDQDASGFPFIGTAN